MKWQDAAWMPVIAAALLLRLVLDTFFMLPSPVGDSEFFLTASVNLCNSGFFGTTAYPIDPTGQARMIWHGFVSPMLLSFLNAGCSARGYFIILWVIQLLTVAAILLLARLRGQPPLAAVGLALFALAAQTVIGFRAETLAILLIVLGELAVQRDRPAVLGALAATLACTQPTVAGLYAVSMLLLRPGLLRQALPVASAGTAVLLLWFWAYPFPAADLLTGILLQAKKLVGRADGNWFAYYVALPALPAWGLLLLGTALLAARRKPALLLLAPVAWFFGPRVPPVYYNLVPLCVLLIGFCLEFASPRAARFVALASLVVGASGLGLMSLRDVLTVQQFGDTFAQTREQVAALERDGVRLARVSSLVALTNPELGVTHPHPATRAATSQAPSVSILAVNGLPQAPCAAAARDVSLRLGSSRLFNSNSGWMIHVCRDETATH